MLYMQSMSRHTTQLKIEYDKNGRDSNKNNIVQQGIAPSMES